MFLFPKIREKNDKGVGCGGVSISIILQCFKCSILIFLFETISDFKQEYRMGKNKFLSLLG